MKALRRIVLVEENLNGIDLRLPAFEKNPITHDIIATRAGVEALDYLHCRGQFTGRSDRLPVGVPLDIKMPRFYCLEVLSQMKSDPLLDLFGIMPASPEEEADLAASNAPEPNACIVKPGNLSSLSAP